MDKKGKLLNFLEEFIKLDNKDFEVIFSVERFDRESTLKRLMINELNKWRVWKFSNYKYDKLIKFLHDYDDELEITQEAKEKHKIDESVDFIIRKCVVVIYKCKYGHDRFEVNDCFLDIDIEKVEYF